MSALRELLAVFGTEFDDRGIKDGEKGIAGFKQTLGELGGVIAGAFALDKIVGFTKEVLETADALAKQSQTLGVAASDLQGWQWAAQLSGSSAEEFTGAFTKFNRNLAEASAGTGPAAEALKALGLTAEDLKTKMPLELLDSAADGIAAMQDPAKRAAAVMAIFGKGAAKLVPLFQEGSEGIKKLRAEVDELGFGFDAEFLEGAQEVNDNVDRLKKGVKGLGIQTIRSLLPALSEWSKVGVEIMKSLIGILKHSNALNAGLVTFGIYGLAKAGSGFVALAQKAGFLKNGLRGLWLQLLPLVAAFLVIEDVWTGLNGGDSVFGDAINKFFGPGTMKKVQDFVKALKEDLGPTIREVFGILTQGKPLNERLKDLQDFITNTLKPQFKADFGEMADTMLKIAAAAGDIAKAISKIGDGFREMKSAAEWFTNLKGPGGLLFPVVDAAANDDAHNAAIARDNPGRAPSAADFDVSQKPLMQQVIALVTGFKAMDAVPLQLGGKSAAPSDPRQVFAQQQVASAPMSSSVVNNDVRQSVQAPITQNFYGIETPGDAGKAAARGAKAGVTEGGEYLRTQRALVTPGAR